MASVKDSNLVNLENGYINTNKLVGLKQYKQDKKQNIHTEKYFKHTGRRIGSNNNLARDQNNGNISQEGNPNMSKRQKYLGLQVNHIRKTSVMVSFKRYEKVPDKDVDTKENNGSASSRNIYAFFLI